MRWLCLIIYYALLRYFPSNSFYIKPIGKASARMRYYCCKHIFKYCGENVGIERLASFGSGRNLVIGDRSNLGINCRVPSDIIIGDDVMMGPNFTCFTSNHKYDCIDIPMNQQGTTPHCQLQIGSDVWIGCTTITWWIYC